VFVDGAMFKHGNLGQVIYVDPGRDLVGVYVSTNGYMAPYGEDKIASFIRRAAKMLSAIRLDRTIFNRFQISIFTSQVKKFYLK